MKTSFLIVILATLFFSCKKDDKNSDRIVNGVNVNVATSSFNTYRTQGLTGHPSVNAVTWNDTLSLAAYNFAKAKTEDTNTPSNIYFLSTGQMILDFPDLLNYSKNANFALYYGYPAETDVTTVINAGFAATDETILNGLMNPNAKQFGLGQFGGKWFLIMSN
jgi:hypothetical protein